MLLPAFTGSVAWALGRVSTGVDATVVVTVAPLTGAVSLEPMRYVEFVITVPLFSGLATATTSCTVADAPAAKLPMFQVTTPAACVPPPVADTNEVFVGTVSEIITPVAFAVPVFE